jgi:hypothetical protein
VKLQFTIFDVESVGSGLRIEGGNLVTSVECPCTDGKVFSNVLNGEDLKSQIMFGIFEVRRLNETGTKAAFATSMSKSFLNTCEICGRELTSSVKISLTDDAWNTIVKSWSESELTSLYLDLIQISVKTKSGYAQHQNNVDDARNLLTVFCKCFTANPLSESTAYFNKLCGEVRDNFAKFVEQKNIAPKTFVQKIKCKTCLQTVEVESTISVKYPTSLAETLRLNGIWNPYVPPAPFVLKYPTSQKRSDGSIGLINSGKDSGGKGDPTQ